MMCELCGKKMDSAIVSIIENVRMEVCNDCSTYGKIVKKPLEIINKSKKAASAELAEPNEEVLVHQYYDIIKKERISRKMDQEQFAKLLNEKLSIIQKVERGDFQPSIHVAKSWEKILKVKLVERTNSTSYAEVGDNDNKRKGSGFTLGDFIRKN